MCHIPRRRRLVLLPLVLLVGLAFVLDAGCTKRRASARKHGPAASKPALPDARQAIIEAVAEQSDLAAADVTARMRLLEDLDYDDTDLAELVNDLEETFRISVPMADAKAFKTVADVINYVMGRAYPGADWNRPVIDKNGRVRI